MQERWELFDHGADIGVRGIGNTESRAFEMAAMALTAVITDLSLVQTRDAVTVHCQAPDRELLLVDWLNALIFEMATRRMLFSRFEVRLERDVLDATAWGEPVNEARHQPAVEPKGATLTELKVIRNPEGHWLAQCVVDV
jgi:SHS2 domain-containing protein